MLREGEGWRKSTRSISPSTHERWLWRPSRERFEASLPDLHRLGAVAFYKSPPRPTTGLRLILWLLGSWRGDPDISSDEACGSKKDRKSLRVLATAISG